MTATRRLLSAFLAALVGIATTFGSAAAEAQEKFIIVASTTSTEQSGLFSHLMPIYKQASGVGKVVFPQLFPEDLGGLTREFYRRFYGVNLNDAQVARVLAGRG